MSRRLPTAATNAPHSLLLLIHILQRCRHRRRQCFILWHPIHHRRRHCRRSRRRTIRRRGGNTPRHRLTAEKVGELWLAATAASRRTTGTGTGSCSGSGGEMVQTTAIYRLRTGLAIKNPPKNVFVVVFFGFFVVFLEFFFLIIQTFLFETDFLWTNKT